MTLAEIVPTVTQLSAVDKLRLIRILAEELDNEKGFFPFEQHRTYYLATPYNSFGAAQILADALAEESVNGG